MDEEKGDDSKMEDAEGKDEMKDATDDSMKVEGTIA